ncbi:hypothetical protein PtA15_1A1019 [Puccinia triticina]|uniref:ABC transporter domain-containing protein n=1 Tax=Puccinia triticina TaxID=208348 RepID=A0ABY7CCM9_9BASI|nr:uncharacterized protein PtA15_1A1019 [Puccinia triticina]WAQ81677.1 hypothetical protein PtA15_1A1019 [Puccinia triticina]
MYSYKDVSELAGYTARVSELFDTMKSIKRGQYEKRKVGSANTDNSQQTTPVDSGPERVREVVAVPDPGRIMAGVWGRGDKACGLGVHLHPPAPVPLSLGTLRDQLIYPDSRADMAARGVSDDDLLRILAIVNLDTIVQREGGWDVVREWQDALSGGDKQRLAICRLYYHSHKLVARLEQLEETRLKNLEGINIAY